MRLLAKLEISSNRYVEIKTEDFREYEVIKLDNIINCVIEANIVVNEEATINFINSLENDLRLLLGDYDISN